MAIDHDQPWNGQERRRADIDRRAVPRGGRRAGEKAVLRDALSRTGALADPEMTPLILVVDDFDDGREMVVEYLEFRGFRVIEARTGAEALSQAATLLPDLVLLDMVLPDISGIEVIQNLRASRRTKHLKIALCTAGVFDNARTRATRAVVDMFIPKPFDLSMLALQIANLVANNRTIVEKF
jgi:two-component system cell cycle response regulator DivK